MARTRKTFPVTTRQGEKRPKVTKVQKYGKSPYLNYCDEPDCKVWMPNGGTCRRHTVTA